MAGVGFFVGASLLAIGGLMDHWPSLAGKLLQGHGKPSLEGKLLQGLGLGFLWEPACWRLGG